MLPGLWRIGCIEYLTRQPIFLFPSLIKTFRKKIDSSIFLPTSVENSLLHLVLDAAERTSMKMRFREEGHKLAEAEVVCHVAFCENLQLGAVYSESIWVPQVVQTTISLVPSFEK